MTTTEPLADPPILPPAAMPPAPPRVPRAATRGRRIRRVLFIAALGALSLWLLVAGVLVLVPAPTFRRPAVAFPAPAAPLRCGPVTGTACVRTRDGVSLAAHVLPGRTPAGRAPLTILLVHGVLSSGAAFERTATLLRDATGATIVRLDLRGHGVSGGAPGDVGHIGQYEEDLADVERWWRTAHPGDRVVLAGHSMGGGVVARYALRRATQRVSQRVARDEPAPDGYLLLAPHLGARSPTSAPAPDTGAATGPGAHDAVSEAPMKLHLARTIGLAMLGAVGVHAFDGLGTLYFNVRIGARAPSYSYRAMVSMAPADHRAALTADSVPMLVVVGSRDEAFRASAYPAAVALHANGRALIVPGVSHDAITTDPTAIAAAAAWTSTLARR